MSKSILVSFADSRIAVSQDGQAVKTIEQFAIGRAGHHTPMFENGSLSLTKRDRNHVSANYPPPHGGAVMPFALFFEQDLACAFHEGPVGVASHGCIHLSAADAQWLFDWAAHDPVDLTIRGPYPASPLFPQA
jgi:hypothetical protein